jgi:hypothetical protein
MANPRCYGIVYQVNVASPTKTAATITTGGTPSRPEVYDLDLSSSSTPSDVSILYRIQRFTAPGTGTAYTPTPQDPADGACTTIAGTTNTVEPTYTSAAILFSCAVNLRATHRYNFDQRSPIKLPYTSSNGVGLFPVNSTFTTAVDGTLYFSE